MANTAADDLLKSFFSNVHMLVAHMDRDFNFIRVNESYAKADNRDMDFFPGRNHFELYPNRENEAIFRSVVETGEPHYSYAKPFEYENAPERGVSHWDWSLQPVKSDSGEVLSLLLCLIDVSRHVQSEEDYLASENNLRRLAENANDGIIVNVDGRHVFANQKIADILGYASPADLLGTGIKDIVHPDEYLAVEKRFNNRLSGNAEPQQYETCFQGNRAEKIPVEVNSSLTTWDGKPAGLVIVRQISDRKRVEDVIRFLALTESSKDFDQFLDNCLHALLNVYGVKYAFIGRVIEPERTYVETLAVMVNGERADNFTYALHGTPCQDIINMDKELIPEHASRLYADDQLLLDMEVESYFGAPITINGKVIGLISVMDVKPMKITPMVEPILGAFATRLAIELERKYIADRLAEQSRLYRSLVESSYAIPWEVDISTFTFTFVGKQAEDILGYPVEDWYQEDFWQSKLHPEDKERALAYCQQQTCRGRDHNFEYRMIAADGRTVWLRDDVIVIMEDDVPVRLQGFMFDITDKKDADEKIRRTHDELEQMVRERTTELSLAKDEAEAANRAKSEFLSRMSHELRTPLNAVMGFAQILEMNLEDDPENLESVLEIVSGSEHLLVLIEELLDLSRIESGKITINIDTIDLPATIAESINFILPQAEQRGISIVFDPKVPLPVLADKVRLKEILLNLLSNAVKYNNENGRIVVEYSAKNDSTASFSVTDTGPGVDEEKLTLLFEPFSRLGAEYSGIEGTGIGLTIVKRLVEQMHGEITVSSGTGQGTCFTIFLPRAG